MTLGRGRGMELAKANVMAKQKPGQNFEEYHQTSSKLHPVCPKSLDSLSESIDVDKFED